MKKIGSASLFGQIKEGMFIDNKNLLHIKVDNVYNYDDHVYLFMGDLYFDEMHRPVFEMKGANPIAWLQDYYHSYVYLSMTLDPSIKKSVDAVINGMIVPLIIECDIPEDKQEHLYNCELAFIENAWTIVIKSISV